MGRAGEEGKGRGQKGRESWPPTNSFSGSACRCQMFVYLLIIQRHQPPCQKLKMVG